MYVDWVINEESRQLIGRQCVPFLFVFPPVNLKTPDLDGKVFVFAIYWIDWF